MRNIENQHMRLQKHIDGKGRSQLCNIVDFFSRRHRTDDMALRDTAFGSWKTLLRHPQQEKMENILALFGGAALARKVFSMWVRLVHDARVLEHQRVQFEHGESQDRVQELERTIWKLEIDRDVLQDQVVSLRKERRQSLATIQSGADNITELKDKLHVERRKSVSSTNSSTAWEQKYQDAAEERAELQAENENIVAELRKLSNLHRTIKANTRIRILKQIERSNYVVVRTAFRSWQLTKDNAKKNLVEPFRKSCLRVADLESQLVECRRDLLRAERNLEEKLAQNKELEGHRTEFLDGQAMMHFFRSFDLPRMILSMFRRLVVLGQKVQTPTLGNVENENALLRDSICEDMSTHRRNKVSKHEFHMYIERLYLTDIPPAHLTQVLCVLLDVDFALPVTANMLQKQMSIADKAFERLDQACRHSRDSKLSLHRSLSSSQFRPAPRALVTSVHKSDCRRRDLSARSDARGPDSVHKSRSNMTTGGKALGSSLNGGKTIGSNIKPDRKFSASHIAGRTLGAGHEARKSEPCRTRDTSETRARMGRATDSEMYATPRQRSLRGTEQHMNRPSTRVTR